MKKLIIISLIFICITPLSVFAQFPVEEEDEYYEKEWALGIMMNTYGGTIGGASVRFSKKFFYEHKITESLGRNSGKTKVTRGRVGEIENERKYHSLSIEFLNIKHPKEEKRQTYTGESVVPGKKNRLYAIRPMFGKEWIVFKKARKQGVQMNFIANAGPSIGIVSPYLIKYKDPARGVITKQFTKQDFLDYSDFIEGTGSLGESLSKASVVVGLALKASLSFEFGVNKRSITGIEAGIIADAYAQKVEIMATDDNRNLHMAMFLTFFFGGRK
ncbi:hypothetical protein [Flammeovirga aprica]|uniref:Outer membrane protein beta-barrel domain-containing protein n=1 Tax=Flammeovirga aprica JL-4 TaxID=694437 RepID=A0A7X9RTT4_9BACT|nr:hypothetical protein [Flammeovirga aprica]NME67712.1 hypothetical protein [Flammeovirga aprica JL-4]